jgi:pyrrolidone-carboxylate peptidase
LQAEWTNDIRTAAEKVTDGEPVANEVRALRSATNLERDALTAEIKRLESLIGPGYKGRGRLWGDRGSLRAAAVDALSGIAGRIPRCTPTQTVEERRLATETAPGEIIASSAFNPYVESFQKAVDKARSYRKAQAVVRAHGLKLWQTAVDRAQTTTPEMDDRPLDWTLLKMMAYLRQYTPRWVKPPSSPTPDVLRRQKDGLLELFEQVSRGMDTARFETEEGVKKILISGFDPFGLRDAVDRGNPSGAAVLSLDGRQLTEGSITATVQGVIFPVRFGDFNAGIVERFFGPFIQSSTPPDMIMTISQGGGSQFEVERFAAGARSSGDYPDNAQRTARGGLARPAQPQGLPAGPGFLETALPAHAIRAALGRSQALNEETGFMEIRPGESRPVPGGNQPTAGSRPVEGSGGGFLSNEIFYRTLLLRREAGAALPVGHLHTPYLAPPGNSVESRTRFANQRRAIVETIEKILRATLPHI